MGDQRLDIPHQDIVRISGRIMRCRAVTMCPQVGHDHPEPGFGKRVGMAELDPVGMGIGKQAVEQDQGSSLPDLVNLERNAVKGGKVPVFFRHHLSLAKFVVGATAGIYRAI